MNNKNHKSDVKAIPDGFHSVTPFLIVDGCRELMEFTKNAFGAEVTSSMDADDGKIMHATIRIGDSLIMVADPMLGQETQSAMLYLYVEDIDAVYKQALKAKGESLREPIDEFYGDRSAGVKDKWGNQWWIATHTEDVSPSEMEKRKEEFMSSAK
jgi:PhnB protein